MGVISLLTDFGLSDPYVGELKGVLLRLAPSARLVDLTHGVRPGAIREGAWVLASGYGWFPAGTCHVAVVDPGVGGSRRGLVASSGGHFFVGPDNGLLVPALESAGGAEIREISVRDPEHVRRGTTFDGRDVFAPIAARLHAGAPLSSLGPEVHDPVPMAPFRPRPVDHGWEVEIVRVDRFGNLVTVADEGFLRRELGEDWRSASVRVGGSSVRGIRLAYGDVPAGQPLLSIGGGGTLEISVRGGSARRLLGVGAGARVRLMAPEEPR